MWKLVGLFLFVMLQQEQTSLMQSKEEIGAALVLKEPVFLQLRHRSKINLNAILLTKNDN